ncbi:hypothetical protein WJX73_009194 [Symbiochloris irregularis]|uniref:Uncharacterized protein n=1 Tax=Symbiochloris irregularis TaxID=706552 RepID=A0AAW1PMP6_9CHLO
MADRAEEGRRPDPEAPEEIIHKQQAAAKIFVLDDASNAAYVLIKRLAGELNEGRFGLHVLDISLEQDEKRHALYACEHAKVTRTFADITDAEGLGSFSAAYDRCSAGRTG